MRHAGTSGLDFIEGKALAAASSKRHWCNLHVGRSGMHGACVQYSSLFFQIVL